jgi:hypothetical protein
MGGRYSFKDDNEWPDTQIFSLEFPENKLIVWEGRSCNGFKSDGADRGTVFYGDNGTIINPGGNSYTVYDKMGKVIKESKDSSDSTDTTNTASPGVNLDQMHISNFLNSIREEKSPTWDCETGHSSTLLTQIANIALLTKQTLEIDPKNGHILNNPAAQQLWGREYEKGWEPVI